MDTADATGVTDKTGRYIASVTPHGKKQETRGQPAGAHRFATGR
jgi:hypothetical protein